ncbi:MAG: hypothetical protein RLZZ292_156 [Bacteroidota bacterium]|jgi:hypothetical protein
MKLPIYISILIVICFNHNILAQNNYDAQWIIGYDHNSSKPGDYNIKLNFNNPQKILAVEKIPETIDMFSTTATICDRQGNLVGYTNGCTIGNEQYKTMENGDSINKGTIYDYYCDGDGGYPLIQSVVTLPMPNDTTKYVFLHLKRSDTAPFYAKHLLQTTVEKKGNAVGRVIEKNKVIFSSDFSDGQINAVRHGNGTDWWVVVPQTTSNIYHKFLLTAKGIIQYPSQSIGKVWNELDFAGQASFSPDGTFYARMNDYNNLSLFSMDRCSGLFSNFIEFDFPKDTLFAAGVSFSPNNRFLYAATGTKLYQYDLTQPNYPRLLIGEYDGFYSPYPPFATLFFSMQLAPDGKIYMTSPTSVKHLHVIHQPNELGVACNFVQHGIELPEFSSDIPSFPNYKLGKLATCMTATEEEASLFDVKINPTPCDANCTIQLVGATTQEKRKVVIYNKLGQEILNTTIENFTSINTYEWQNGVYFCTIEQYGKTRVIKKIIVQHDK